MAPSFRVALFSPGSDWTLCHIRNPAIRRFWGGSYLLQTQSGSGSRNPLIAHKNAIYRFGSVGGQNSNKTSTFPTLPSKATFLPASPNRPDPAAKIAEKILVSDGHPVEL